jgi:hypothetical protein
MRVTRVVKAQKEPGACGKCGKKIQKGDPYMWWKFRYGGRRVRCPNCPPSRADLTQNDVLGIVYDAQDTAQADVAAADSPDALQDAMIALAESIQEAMEACQEKMDNIESGFGHTEIQAYQDAEERQSSLEDWKGEAEGFSPEDIDVSTTHGEITVAVNFGTDPFDRDAALEAAKDVGIAEDALDDVVDALEESWRAEFETQRDEASGIADNCPL